MDVFILAGGLGTRIRALFPDRPKALIPVWGKPFLEWQIERLAKQGFHHFVLCVSHFSEQIVRHFGDGAAWGVRVEYSIEAEPMGTAGALKLAAPFFQETSLVLNGDTYLATDYRALIAAHQEKATHGQGIGSLGLVAVQDTGRFGQVILDGDNRIVAFREKTPSPAQAGLINAGLYVLAPTVLETIPAGRPASIENDTFPALVAAQALYGFPVEGAFVDMGTPEGYAHLKQLLQ